MSEKRRSFGTHAGKCRSGCLASYTGAQLAPPTRIFCHFLWQIHSKCVCLVCPCIVKTEPDGKRAKKQLRKCSPGNGKPFSAGSARAKAPRAKRCAEGAPRFFKLEFSKSAYATPSGMLFYGYLPKIGLLGSFPAEIWAKHAFRPFYQRKKAPTAAQTVLLPRLRPLFSCSKKCSKIEFPLRSTVA